MIPLYRIEEHDPDLHKMRLEEFGERNYWGTEFIARAQFEDATHLLHAVDDNHHYGRSEQAPDISRADTAIWTIPETAWDWLSTLEADGCRIAHNVRIEKGKRQFKLVYAAPIMDLFDIESSGAASTDILGPISWNGDTISWVRQYCFYEWDGPVPLMFQVLHHNRNGALYRGSSFGISGRSFVSQAFKDEYERRNLTGLRFIEVPRTAAPPGLAPRVK